MASSSSLLLIIFFIYGVSISSSSLSEAHEQNDGDIEIGGSVGRRFLLGFKETPKGSNITFECSPSGPCVSCNSSEKKKEKYRCSETGYRIPFKCKEVKGAGSKKKDKEEKQSDQSNVDDEEVVKDKEEMQNVDEDEEVVESEKPRNLLDDDSAASKVKSQSYKTYRSCVPSADEEKLSVLGFEAIMLGLFLMSGTAIYIRKKQTVPMFGVSNGRSSQSNPRF